MKLLNQFAPEGDRAYSSMLQLYGLLDHADADEAELIRLLETESRADARLSLLRTLHEKHDQLRTAITESAIHFQALAKKTQDKNAQ